MKVRLKNIIKVYNNEVHALKGMSLEVDQGDFIAILGKSGAGKSSLLHIINRLILPTSGSVMIDEKDVAKLSKKELRKFRSKIGIISQEFNLIDQLTVLENVMVSRASQTNFLRVFFGLYKKNDLQIAIDALNQVDLLDKVNSKAYQLSGGQKQRVAIARCLAQKPKLILADEPVSALDFSNSKIIMDYLKKINKELGITVIANLHQIEVAKNYADRIVGFNEGRIVFDSPPLNLNQEAVDQIFNSTSNYENEVAL